MRGRQARPAIQTASELAHLLGVAAGVLPDVEAGVPARWKATSAFERPLEFAGVAALGHILELVLSTTTGRRKNPPLKAVAPRWH